MNTKRFLCAALGAVCYFAFLQAQVRTEQTFEKGWKFTREDNAEFANPGYNAVYVNDKRHWPLFELARAYNMPVAIHTGDTAWPSGLLKYSHPLTVDEAAVAFPDVTFVIAHCGCPWFADAAEVACKNANVCIDLSGLVEGNPKPLMLLERQRGFLRQLHTWLNYLGNYEKIMYGSDWPLVNIPLYIWMISHVVPECYHEDVFYKNAVRLSLIHI